MIISVLTSVKPTGRFKIPNQEVMMDWARWAAGGTGSSTNILDICVEGKHPWGKVAEFHAETP